MTRAEEACESSSNTESGIPQIRPLQRLSVCKHFFDDIFVDFINIYQLIEVIKKTKIINNNTLLIIHRNKKFKENISEYLKILREKKYGLSKIVFCKIN